MSDDSDIDGFEVEELDAEESAGRSQAHKPKAKTYIIWVDKTQFKAPQLGMTGRAILSLASKLPLEEYRLKQMLHGGEMKQLAKGLRSPGTDDGGPLPERKHARSLPGNSAG